MPYMYTCPILYPPDVGVGFERSEYSLDEGTSQSVCVLFSRQLQRSLSLSSDFEDLRGLLRGETEVLFNYNVSVYSSNRFMNGFV